MRTMYERILVPTDGSVGMERVVEHAAELAAAHDAVIHGVYVVDSASFTGLPMETSWEGIADLLRQEGESALEDLERVVDGRAPVEGSVVDGSPSREIVSLATEEDCDLILMGTHGRGGIDRLLLGSVAERVVRTAEVPVLTVRVDTEAGADDAESGERRERREEYDPRAGSDSDAGARSDSAVQSGSDADTDSRYHPREDPEYEPEPEPGAR